MQIVYNIVVNRATLCKRGLSVCLSVCLSLRHKLTSRSSIKTADGKPVTSFLTRTGFTKLSQIADLLNSGYF